MLTHPGPALNFLQYSVREFEQWVRLGIGRQDEPPPPQEETTPMPDKPDQTFSFEDIDKLVKQADLAGLEKQSAQFKASAASPADILAQICPIYKTVRPILKGLTQIPFIPDSWKKVIKAFIRTMDLICPQH
jgi:hypothetical protein